MIKKIKGTGIYDSKPALQKTLEGILQSKEKNKSLRPWGRKDDARIIVKQEGMRKENTTESTRWQQSIEEFQGSLSVNVLNSPVKRYKGRG